MRIAPLCLLAVLAMAPLAHRAAGDDSPRLPNIVFLMADDMGYGDPQCYNADSKIPTPQMDKLAAEGLRFTDAHSPSAVCTPTRYGLLTGRYAWRSRLKRGVLNGYSPALIEDGRATVATMLQSHGYHTACIGKWHLGFQDQQVDYDRPLRPGPVTVGFDRFFGIPASLDMPPYVYVDDDRPVEPPTEQVAASGHRRAGGGGFWRGGAIAPGFQHVDVHGRITEQSVAYIEQRAREAPDQPFFLYVPLASPHTPWLPTERFQGRTGVEPPGGYYTDFVAEVDWTVGQIDDALERTGLTEKTLYIVTSDNGAHWLSADIDRHGHRANGPWRGQKADIHEGGHRVPYIARWPGRVPAGSTSDVLTDLTDLFATAAAIVGHELAEDEAEDSHNLLPALLGQALDAPIREAAVHHSLQGTFAIRQGDWKLIPDNLGSGGFTSPARVDPAGDDPGGQLYNLADDPGEQRNVWNDHPEIVQRLTELLDRYRDTGRSRPDAK
jgi:arylsulfatase A